MTENSRRKRDARAYMAAHQGTSYTAALRIVQARRLVTTPATMPPQAGYYESPSLDQLLADALRGDEQLLDHDLSIDPTFRQFFVDVGPYVEDPVTADSVDIEVSSMTYDVHDEFDGGTVVGEAHVDALVTWSACVFKGDFYGAEEGVSWHVTDHDWNEHYVRVSGEISVELVYHFQHTELQDEIDELTLEALVQQEHPRRT